MTAEQREELNNLMALLESGAISQAEFDELATIIYAKGEEQPAGARTVLPEEENEEDAVRSYGSPPADRNEPETSSRAQQHQEYYQPEEKKRSWPKILAGISGLLLFIWAGNFVYKKLNADSPEALAGKVCQCEKLNSEAYLAALGRIKDSLIAGKVRDRQPVVAQLSELATRYSMKDMGIEVTKCFEDFKLEEQKFLAKYPKMASEGVKFWESYGKEVLRQTDEGKASSITQTITEINAQLNNIRPPAATMDSEEATAFITRFFRTYTGPDFNAPDWFAPEVDFYFRLSNISPEQINAQVRQKAEEWKDPEIKLNSRSVRLESENDGVQTWVCTAHYTCLRQSKNMEQQYDATYQFVIFDGKIKSITEIGIENERFIDEEI